MKGVCSNLGFNRIVGPTTYEAPNSRGFSGNTTFSNDVEKMKKTIEGLQEQVDCQNGVIEGLRRTLSDERVRTEQGSARFKDLQKRVYAIEGRIANDPFRPQTIEQVIALAQRMGTVENRLENLENAIFNPMHVFPPAAVMIDGKVIGLRPVGWARVGGVN